MSFLPLRRSGRLLRGVNASISFPNIICAPKVPCATPAGRRDPQDCAGVQESFRLRIREQEAGLGRQKENRKSRRCGCPPIESLTPSAAAKARGSPPPASNAGRGSRGGAIPWVLSKWRRPTFERLFALPHWLNVTDRS